MEIKKFIDPSTLDAICEEKETIEVVRNFSKEEIQSFKAKLATVVIEFDFRNNLAARFKKLLADSMEIEDLINETQELFEDVSDLSERGTKELAKEKESIKKQIKDGFSSGEEEVYKYKDHEEGIVAFYDILGHLVSHRSMYPNERQAKLFNIKNA